jgi:hypothetical protein
MHPLASADAVCFQLQDLARRLPKEPHAFSKKGSSLFFEQVASVVTDRDVKEGLGKLRDVSQLTGHKVISAKVSFLLDQSLTDDDKHKIIEMNKGTKVYDLGFREQEELVEFLKVHGSKVTGLNVSDTELTPFEVVNMTELLDLCPNIQELRAWACYSDLVEKITSHPNAKGLKGLWLQNVLVSLSGIEEIAANLQELERLNLGEASFRNTSSQTASRGLYAIKSLPHLKRLNISQSDIREGEATLLAGMKNLEVLNVQGVEIGPCDLAVFADLKKMPKLRLLGLPDKFFPTHPEELDESVQRDLERLRDRGVKLV